MWVLFELEGEKSWAGVFGSDRVGASNAVGVAALDHPSEAYVFAGGRDYLINYRTHELLLRFDRSRVEGVLAVQADHRFVMWDSTKLQAVDAEGATSWVSRRVSWDGLRDVHLDANIVKGEAWSPIDHLWMGFELDPANGEFSGGSYVSGPWDSREQDQ